MEGGSVEMAAKKPKQTELLSAIRKKCLDCSGGMRNEVRDCRIKDCPLHSYRASAMRDAEQVSLMDTLKLEETG